MGAPVLCHPSRRAPVRSATRAHSARRMQLRQRPRNRELLQGRARCLRGAYPEGTRHPHSGEQMGVVVRSLPSRVPLLQGSGEGAQGQYRLHRRELQRQPLGARRSSSRRSPFRTAISTIRSSRSRRPSTRSRPFRARRSTTRRASSRSCTRAGTPARTSWRRTSSVTPADGGGSRGTHGVRADRSARAARAHLLRRAGRVVRGRPGRTRSRRPRTSSPWTTGS